MSKNVVLRSPDGKRTWRAEDKTQENNLRAQGWTDEQPRTKQDATPANKAVKPDNK